MIKKYKQFTLIELIVVLTILTVLMTMLVCTLDTINVKKESLVCKNNLRQVHYAAMMYTDDNDGYLPTEKGAYWVRYELSPYLDEPSDDLKPEGVFFCPSGAKEVDGAVEYWTSYCVSRLDSNLPNTSQYGGWFWGRTQRKVSMILNDSLLMYPAELLIRDTDKGMAHPMCWTPQYFNPDTSLGYQHTFPGRFHDNSTNYMFLDGSVKGYEGFPTAGQQAGNYWQIWE